MGHACHGRSQSSGIGNTPSHAPINAPRAGICIEGVLSDAASVTDLHARTANAPHSKAPLETCSLYNSVGANEGNTVDRMQRVSTTERGRETKSSVIHTTTTVVPICTRTMPPYVPRGLISPYHRRAAQSSTRTESLPIDLSWPPDYSGEPQARLPPRGISARSLRSIRMCLPRQNQCFQSEVTGGHKDERRPGGGR